MNKKKKEKDLKAEIAIRAYVVFLSIWIVILCNTLAKVGSDSAFNYFFLVLAVTIFYCVILYKHKVQK